MRFLYPTPGAWDTEMCAGDYVRDVTVLQEKWPEFDDDLKGIDKEIAHLTYLRPPNPTQWDINNKLTPCLIPFVLSVVEDRVHERFKPLAYAALVDASNFLASMLTGRISVPVATQSLQPS
jgi:hypothetical protein